jgi:peptidyl-prolyl cis-trans isomerase B (cyclophilin B)
MKLLKSLCAFSLALGLVTALAQETNQPASKAEPKPESKDTKPADEVAVIKTSEGELVIAFWSDVAPKTVENFKTLAKKGFYDGTAFHRIIDGFMIQGGDPKTKDASLESQWGMGDPGYKIKGETNRRDDRKHIRGVISMANSGHPDTAGCQFFICLKPTPQLDGGYTTFGIVIKGDDVLTKLGKSPVKPNPFDPRREVSRPVKRVSLESVKIVPADSVK